MYNKTSFYICFKGFFNKRYEVQIDKPGSVLVAMPLGHWQSHLKRSSLCELGLRSLLRDPHSYRVNSVRMFRIGHPGACFPWNGCIIIDVSVTWVEVVRIPRFSETGRTPTERSRGWLVWLAGPSVWQRDGCSQTPVLRWLGPGPQWRVPALSASKLGCEKPERFNNVNAGLVFGKWVHILRIAFVS